VFKEQRRKGLRNHAEFFTPVAGWNDCHFADGAQCPILGPDIVDVFFSKADHPLKKDAFAH
jgi:hypothetical protein